MSVRFWARAGSAGILLLVLAIAVGEGPPNLLKATWGERVQFLLFALVCAGLLMAWRRERLGGLVALVALAAFYVVEYALSGRFPRGWAWAALAVPAVLFLVCGGRSEAREAHGRP